MGVNPDIYDCEFTQLCKEHDSSYYPLTNSNYTYGIELPEDGRPYCSYHGVCIVRCRYHPELECACYKGYIGDYCERRGWAMGMLFTSAESRYEGYIPANLADPAVLYMLAVILSFIVMIAAAVALQLYCTIRIWYKKRLQEQKKLLCQSDMTDTRKNAGLAYTNELMNVQDPDRTTHHADRKLSDTKQIDYGSMKST